MLKKILITTSTVCGICLLTSCSSGSSTSNTSGFNYPTTETVNATTDYFGTTIADPYQWLESTTAPNVLNWVDEQNRFTQNYFDQIPYYSQIVAQVNQIYSDSSTQSSLLFAHNKTIIKGNGVFFYQLNTQNNQHLQTIPGIQTSATVSSDNIIYVTDQPNHPGKVFLNLNKMYPNDIIQLKTIKTFDNGKYLVFGLSHNYGDLVDLHVLNLTSSKDAPYH
jgi:prolyl oligopeptidase